MPDTYKNVSVIEMTADIVSAYVGNNSVPAGELPVLLRSVHGTLDAVINGTRADVAQEPLQPKIPIKKSVTNDYIVCLEDGKRFKSLKRHLSSAFGMTPQDYRAKWGLPKDYPMVAPAYASARSNLAKTMGLGRRAGAPPLTDEDSAPAANDQDGAPERKPRRRTEMAA